MLTNRTPVEEFHARWKRAQAVCRENGVDALVVWSRGGGTVDTADDVIYLANYCGVFPYCPDLPGVWSGLSTAAVILPAQGEPVLVIDSGIYRTDVVAVKDVRSSSLVPDKVGEVLKEMGLSDSRLGLVAGPWLLLSNYRRLIAACPDVEFVEMDYAIEALRARKTAHEFELLREAAAVGEEAMLAMMKSASTVGTTEADAVAAAYSVAIRRGSAMIDAACASGPYSKFYAYGMAPNWTTRELRAGDVFHCDMYGAVAEGYRFDFSRSVVAGGKASAAQDEIYDGAIAAIEAGIAAIRPGVSAEALYKVVYDVLDARGIFCGYPLHGHSYGLGWESPWLIPGQTGRIEAGMAIAVECMAGREDVGYVKFEHNVLVHDDHTELLTTCPARV